MPGSSWSVVRQCAWRALLDVQSLRRDARGFAHGIRAVPTMGPAVISHHTRGAMHCELQYLARRFDNVAVELDSEWGGDVLVYRRNHRRHRTDGPAIEWPGGTKFCYCNDHRHRTDGPAADYCDGEKAWFVDGKRHRADGPAIELSDGGKIWYVDGRLHRLDGPAIERANGSKMWYVDGQLHRTDGPAIETGSGGKEWWIHGVKQEARRFIENMV